MKREVPIDRLRDAYEHSGLSVAEIARRMGWTHDPGGRPEKARVKRSLGLLPVRSGWNGRYYPVRSTSYERAVSLVEAMGLDPVDYGL